ncbi:hypothetical protein ACAF76_002985 [Brevibacillus sp. TJ4]|uniref:hypothetical protein n=1 Tax=Brevibacillus sp. TJ4 TaxID=3234853 RepID=UPI0037D571F1
MEKDMVEMPQIEIPDEVRQVEIPEIGETTPHPKPESPLATYTSSEGLEQEESEAERIGFFS